MPLRSQPPLVEIRGEGLAACACAALLTRQGFRLLAEREGRAKLPAILANQATQSLLRDIFADTSLFAGLEPINRRIVAWGNPEPIFVPHSAVVISEQDLLDRLWNRIALQPETPSVPAQAQSESDSWVIAGSRAFRISKEERAFGSREAVITPVDLSLSAPRDACWIEAVTDGWLFLLPAGRCATEGSGAMLIAVGNETAALLEQSRLVRPEIAAESGPCKRVFCSPRISMALAGPGWLGCGTAAMSFDPISGEGAGHAAREAILAAAVLSAIQRGLPTDRLLAHYAARLTAGFQRHLEVCLRFYSEAHTSPWWAREIELLREGIAWCGTNIDTTALRGFQLLDFDLRPRA